MNKGFALLLLLLPLACNAEISAGVTFSYHAIEENPGFNFTKVHGIASYYDEESKGFLAILAPNSYGDPAILGGFLLKGRGVSWLNGATPSIFIGGVVGYKDNIEVNIGEIISPYGWLGLTFNTFHENIKIEMRLVPNVYTVGVEYKFK